MILLLTLQDLQKAMQMVGLNPTEQEVVDIPNELARAGLIYFPDFCSVVLERLRQPKEEEENFYQCMFKVKILKLLLMIWMMSLQMMCGTESYPADFKAKKYKLSKNSLTKVIFKINTNLAVSYLVRA